MVDAPADPTAGLEVPVAYRVVDRCDETDDVATLDLAPQGRPIDEPQPGQFTMLYTFGVGEVPISVSGCPSDGGTLRHTVRAAGPATQALQQLQPGDVLGLRGPFGRGWPDVGALPPDHDVVIVSGGIGLAPLRPVVRQALTRRQSPGRVALLVGARTPADLLFAGELEAWRDSSDIDVAITVDAAPPSWSGDVGVVTELIPAAPIEPARTVAMVCGPEVMMRFVARALVDRGVDPANVLVSLERNMHCAVRRCGHCQLGPLFVCAEGPVVPWSVAEPLLAVRRW